MSDNTMLVLFVLFYTIVTITGVGLESYKERTEEIKNSTIYVEVCPKQELDGKMY